MLVSFATRNFSAEVRNSCKLPLMLTMLELNSKQRAVLADKLSDFANIAAGAMVFGQSISERPFSATLATLGGACWVLFLIVAVVLAGRKDR